MKKISCIIPAYNEEKRIAKVLEVVCGHPLISEVIVVDDGSKDATADVVRGFAGARLITMEKNGGKSKAVFRGVNEAAGELVMFVDSDLVGLDRQAITDLINPVLSGVADVSISLRKNTPALWRWIGIDYISGERVMPKTLLAQDWHQVPKLARFGLEVFMNKLIVRNKSRIAIVNWKNVISPWKYEKAGLLAGMKADILMLSDIFRTVSVFEVIYQIARMRALRVRV